MLRPVWRCNRIQHLMNRAFAKPRPIEVVIDLIAGAYGVRATPTLISTLLLSGKVKAAARDYFRRHPY